MATEHGILQGLWGEVRPAVEARVGRGVRPFIALVNRHKTAEALALVSETIGRPPEMEREALADLARRALSSPDPNPPGDPATARVRLWKALCRSGSVRWANCRLLLDNPLPDRVWLFRRGSWILYRWTEDRFLGTPLPVILAEVESGRWNPLETMLSLPVCGTPFPNPKLPL